MLRSSLTLTQNFILNRFHTHVHTTYTHTHAQKQSHTNTELHSIFILTGNAIKDFFNTFDAKFKGARRTIKVHIQEHHMLDCIHSHLAATCTYKTIPDPIDRLKCIMKEHYLKVSLQIQSATPPKLKLT